MDKNPTSTFKKIKKYKEQRKRKKSEKGITPTFVCTQAFLLPRPPALFYWLWNPIYLFCLLPYCFTLLWDPTLALHTQSIRLYATDVQKQGTFTLFVPKSRNHIDVYFVWFGKSSSNLHKNDAQKLGIFDLFVAKSN